MPSAARGAVAGITSARNLQVGFDGDTSWYLASSDWTGTWWEDISRVVSSSAPWLAPPLRAAPANTSTWLLRASVDVTNSSIRIQVFTTNTLHLLAGLAADLEVPSLGVSIPPVNISAPSPATSSVSIESDRATGRLVSLSIGLVGSGVTLGSVLTWLGLSLPVQASTCTISDPVIVITAPQGNAPATLQIALAATILPISSTAVSAALLVEGPAATMSMKVTTAVPLFNSACTGTSAIIVFRPDGLSFDASLRLSCPAVPSLTDVAASLSYANGAASLDVTGSLSFLDGAVAVSQLSLSSTSAAAYVAGSCTGSVAGATGSLQFNLTKPTASVPFPKTSLALTIPNINFGTLASSLWATAAGQSLPSVLMSLTLPSVTIQTPDLSLRAYTFSASVPAGAVDIAFDRQGVLAAVLAMKDMTVPSLLSSIGATYPLPSPGSMFSINPISSFRMTSSRSNDTFLRALRGYNATISAGTTFNFGLVLPTLSPGVTYQTNLAARTATGGFPAKFTLQLTSAISMFSNLITLSNVNFEPVSGVGIRSSCTANLLGVTLSGNLSFALSGGRPTLAARVLNVNLTTLVSNARMVGPLPPAMASRLSSLTFPSFSLDSYGPDGKSYFATAAGPAGGPSSLLSLAVDSYGMRYFKLDMGTTCVNLGSALQSLGVTMAVPATSFTLCNLVVTRVPAVSGVANVTLPDNTTLLPSLAASFMISIPELGFSSVSARISTSQAAPSAVQIQLTGALSLFGGACTATSFVLQVSASAASYAASLRLSCPAVPSLTDVAASLSYANGTMSLDVTGSLSFLDGAVAVSQLSLSSTSAAAYVAGSCTGSVAGATGSLQFNLTKPTASVPVPKTSLALTIPNINFGTLASSLWATAAGQSLPSVLTSLTLPSVTIQTPDISLGAYTFSALVLSGAVDIAFDRQGVLAAVIAMDGMSVPSLLSSIGATYALPSTDSMFTTDGSPSFRMTSSRSTDALLTALRGYSAAISPGTIFNFGLVFPTLSPGTAYLTNVVARTAAGGFPDKFTLQISSPISIFGDLITLSDMNFEAVSGVGIRSSCTANLLGVTLSGNLSFALSGGRPTLAARVLDVNLTTLVSNARMVGPLPPAMASRLSSLTFPSFSLDSYGPDGKSYFATAAGPAGGPSSLLSLAVDSYGMRYFKLDMGTTCVNLGSALQSLGVTMAVPATSFTLCNLVVTRVPAVTGVPDVVLPDATTMAPSFAASFIISIPELGFNNVAARIATSQSTPSTVQIQA
ncbi:hypothetical protein CHLRE_13g589940v5 [Chlamydomonas reinhardtii]|uniref:Uncharacterized protein n=1 Tax=Chlamydomonas reinhardtii TaxID=3055 RepID=A0A2K3D104_CHLRE|nr:uncharacterized protein CHLRE_13g589940v5 [Chlamydomonas reinhardtii]PNW74216.1 hypothetical protein CHLRE_13g589940v5 [Chlamydomonas reinhardtii]